MEALQFVTLGLGIASVVVGAVVIWQPELPRIHRRARRRRW